ncbi:hypothetical protein JB92DRAFT_2829080 [Gautieria morchelliformis]|nr:hypothetical protein JB92DRAFT_2829080 [Gautieria morchelliformis]
MAEALAGLAVAASVVAIVQTTEDVTTKCSAYRIAYKDTSKDMNRLSRQNFNRKGGKNTIDTQCEHTDGMPSPNAKTGNSLCNSNSARYGSSLGPTPPPHRTFPRSEGIVQTFRLEYRPKTANTISLEHTLKHPNALVLHASQPQSSRHPTDAGNRDASAQPIHPPKQDRPFTHADSRPWRPCRHTEQ